MSSPTEDKPEITSVSCPQPQKKYPIICKFWMSGSCTKESKCDYLHEIYNTYRVKNNSLTQKICPHYKLGFCKMGDYCNFSHIISNKEELPNPLPIWYLEYIFEKPIFSIFQEYEENYPEDISKIKEKVNSFRFKQFDKTDNLVKKKEGIVNLLELKTRFFFSKMYNHEELNTIFNQSLISVQKKNLVKYKEALKSCENVILILYKHVEEEKKFFAGFVKLESPISPKEAKYDSLSKSFIPKNNEGEIFFTKFLWKTKIPSSELEKIVNPLNESKPVIDSKDGQEISNEIGIYICKYMMNVLSKKDIEEFESKNSSLIRNKLKVKTKEKEKDRDLDKNKIGIQLQSILYEELNSLKNSKFGQNNEQNSNSLPIIFTNISNLQVNITPQSQSPKKEHRKNKSKKKYYKCNERKDSDFSMNSDETLILETKSSKDTVNSREKNHSEETKFYLKNKRERSREKERVKEFSSKDGKMEYSKLFTKAIGNVAMSFFKNEQKN